MYNKVFISYAREDSKLAEKLFDFLISTGIYVPWLDKKNIFVGQNWEIEIKLALKKADFIFILFSKTSVKKRGFIQKEFKLALEYCEERLDTDIFIIPCKVDDCEIPEKFSKFQWVDFKTADYQEQILKALEKQRKKYVDLDKEKDDEDEYIIEKFCKEYNIDLEKIDVYSRNQPGYVVNAIGRIEVLNLYGQNIKKIPEYITKLSELKTLHLEGNNLSSIENIAGLSKLETLVVDFNNITDISVIKEIKSIKKFHAIDNPINDITPLKNLINIESVSINCENVKDLKPISYILSLKELTLENIDKPIDNTFFQRCKQIKSLKIRNGVIKDIQSLSHLTELEELDLTNNKISNIQSISELTQLKKLDLSNNSISDIAPLKSLKQIESINLVANPITDLEPLSNFDMRFVFGNRQFFPFRHEVLISKCNNISNPPIEIVKLGNDAIQRYFNKVKDEGIDYIFEAKLILVGDGDSGKTSLKRRLLDENANLPTSDKHTRGIEIVDFEFEKGKIAHIWDFGGQVIYYPVHRFFLTENAIFVLLASSRHYHHNFDYWIPTISQFGGKSPIIIGQTCHEGLATPWNNLNIYLANPNFNIIKTLNKPYYEIDLTNKNRGLDEIKKSIIGQLQHFQRGIPKPWSRIRNTLLDKSKFDSYISFQTFTDLCKELEPKHFKNKEDIKDCCQFFHDIGAVLWYSEKEGLRDWVILKPEWAMNAVYKIIDDCDIQFNNGYIHKSDFERLWHNDSYIGKHTVLKKMLETFKIAFPTKHSQGEYILPAKLTSMPWEKKWAIEDNSLRLEYVFDFMPRGIVNQLSAELSRYIHDKDVWNNAVNFTSENSKSQIIEDSYNKKLSITSKGVDARGMNILIMNAIKNIIVDYKGVKARIHVPCTCKKCQQLESPSMFLYDNFLEWQKRNITTVTCNESGESLSISKLLYNAGFETISSRQQTVKTVSIFLASSEELKDDRKEFEIFINRENKELIDRGVFIKLAIWEDFIDRMSKNRLQDEYNIVANNSDIFVSLFWTKVGKYTKEEFNRAYTHFKENGRPLIYTYFKNTPVNIKDIKQDNINSLLDFKQELGNLGHYPTNYENIEDLKYQFKMQLQKILPDLNNR